MVDIDELTTKLCVSSLVFRHCLPRVQLPEDPGAPERD